MAEEAVTEGAVTVGAGAGTVTERAEAVTDGAGAVTDGAGAVTVTERSNREMTDRGVTEGEE